MNNCLAGAEKSMAEFLLGIVIVGILFAIISGILDSRCPNCRNLFELRRTEKILVEATYDSEGKKLIIRHCSYCSHHREYEEIIPELSDAADFL
jgi:hypothetical protein